MKQIKIVIEASALTEPHMSGIGHLTLELIRALEAHPDYAETFIITLVAGFDRLPMLKRWNLEKAAIKTIPLPQRLINIIWKFNLLPPMDILLGRGVYVFPNYKNWWLLFSKSITFIHDISFLLHPEFVAPKNQQFLEKNIPRWAKRTTKIAAISKNAKNEIVENLHISEGKIRVIYPGVDTAEFYRRNDAEIARVKKYYGIDGEYLLYVGNIEPRKNLVKLMEAYGNLPTKLRDTYGLVLVGGQGWLNEPIVQAIKDAQTAGLHITRPEQFVVDEDLPALYSGATMLTHPSIYEGFGLSLLQAMACGTAVMAGNNSSMTEVVDKAGLLVDAANEREIRAAIQQILEQKQLRTELVNKGLRRIKDFSWKAMADGLVQVVNELQGRPS